MNPSLVRGAAYAGWAVAGAGGTLSVLTPFTIGPIVVPLTAVWTALLASRSAARGPAMWGLLAGPALLAFWLAWQNRGGPGTVCTTTFLEQSCTEEWSPWPFVGVAFALLGVSIAVFVRARHGVRASAGTRR